MLFAEALKALQEGSYVCRPYMDEKCQYLAFLPGMTSVWTFIISGTINQGNYLFLMDDFLADDWKVYEKKCVVDTPVELELVQAS